jgi:hypothetical protein
MNLLSPFISISDLRTLFGDIDTPNSIIDTFSNQVYFILQEYELPKYINSGSDISETKKLQKYSDVDADWSFHRAYPSFVFQAKYPITNLLSVKEIDGYGNEIDIPIVTTMWVKYSPFIQLNSLLSMGLYKYDYSYNQQQLDLNYRRDTKYKITYRSELVSTDKSIISEALLYLYSAFGYDIPTVNQSGMTSWKADDTAISWSAKGAIDMSNIKDRLPVLEQILKPLMYV